ncbi:carbonic anhydrase-like [Mizuhopecten yessoensis]|uniref:carbonic anhydrase n=1 Tax=Mizuhopecten yessoensis TaxID=6573 RepID=A0A210PWZ0_MIZYE|nr:carbonic anhydrase-like [Mizuhopecten yessoensis]XP_021373120.1 carbonic anhydrase-like [Mizuhopecten yessoensis]OWF40985.1 Carbonic anhydrase 15 [Mizuhopecten yessoensis]
MNLSANMSTLRNICLLLFGLLTISSASDWHYGSHDAQADPSGWAHVTNSVCNGQYQSPIDVPSVMKQDYSVISNFRLQGFGNTNQYTTTIKNNGHTLQVDIAGDLIVSGGGLPGSSFKMAQLHFHWGHDNSDGSEHTYNGRPYPMEMHIVNYNQKYSSIQEAIDKDDGLAVLGFWVTHTTTDNSAFAPITNAIGNVTYKGTNNPLTLNVGAMLPKNMNRFFRYKGSLTTPPCFESVTWTMFEDKIFLSRQQLDMFRSASSDGRGQTHPLVDNFRPVHPLNGREVSRNFKLEDELNTAAHFSNVGVTFTVIIAILQSYVF